MAKIKKKKKNKIKEDKKENLNILKMQNPEKNNYRYKIERNIQNRNKEVHQEIKHNRTEKKFTI